MDCRCGGCCLHDRAFLLKICVKNVLRLAFQPPDDRRRRDGVARRVAIAVPGGRELRAATKNVAGRRIERTVAARTDDVAADTRPSAPMVSEPARSLRARPMRRGWIIVGAEQRPQIAFGALCRPTLRGGGGGAGGAIDRRNNRRGIWRFNVWIGGGGASIRTSGGGFIGGGGTFGMSFGGGGGSPGEAALRRRKSSNPDRFLTTL